MKKLRILIPIDIEGEPDSACNFLQGLSPEKVEEIRLINVLQYPSVPGDFTTPLDYMSDYYLKIEELQRTELARQAARPCLAGHHVTTLAIASPGADVAAEIGAQAEEFGADLVLLVSRHRTGMDGLFTGTFLMRIMRHCHRPMLVLSPGASPKFHRVGFATDLTEASTKVLNLLRPLCEVLGAGIVCYRVNTVEDFLDQRSFVKQRTEFLQKAGLVPMPDMAQYNAVDLESGIVEGAEDQAADVLALATHARRGLSRLLNGSITETLVKHSSMPILVFNVHP